MEYIKARLAEGSTWAAFAAAFGSAAAATTGTMQIILGALAAGCVAIATSLKDKGPSK